MAIKKTKALHVRGSNARPVSIYYMTGVNRYDSAKSGDFRNTPTLANDSLAALTGNAYPNGLEFGITVGNSSNGSAIMSRFYANHYRGLAVSDLAVGDKLVFGNGSYLLVTYAWHRDASGDPEGGTDSATFRYYTKDDELVYNGDYTVDIAYGSKAYGESGRYYVNAAVLPWKTELYNGRYYLYAGSIDAVYVSSLGVYVPQYRCYCGSSKEPVNAALSIKFFDGIPEYDPDDPYPDVPDSGEEEPDPDGIPEPDDIPFPDDPDINVTDLGFVTLYAPTRAQLKDLSDFMWSSFFDIDSLKKLFTDPMDCILGLNMLPFHVNQGSNATVYLGNISSGVTMPTALSQWQTISCGSVNIGQVYDTYLDYAPYTKMHIFLPFIGIQELNTDDVAHKVISVKYKIDILSCACIAFIMVDDVVLYQFSGTCGYSVPVTTMDFSSLFRASVDVAISAVTLAASAGAGGAGAAAGGSSGLTATAAMDASTSAQIAQFASNSAGAIGNSKTRVKRSGALSGGPGIMGIQKPYLILEIPRICKPARQQHFLGYPSFITIQVSGISGYAEFESIILSGVTCTEEERHMLMNIFKGGVYV